MSDKTKIQWTEATWNPWHGCIKVSPGCKNCYMYRDKLRYGQDPAKVVRSKTTFRDPLKWTDPRIIFTCSWSDFFIKEADEWRDEAWDIIGIAKHHTYQILTKRTERIFNHLPSDWGWGNWQHVWLGASAESQEEYDKRRVHLETSGAYIIWWSLEPLLGPIAMNLNQDRRLPDWIVIGGESGNEARPFNAEWARSIIGQCRILNIPVFVKQLGARPYHRPELFSPDRDVLLRLADRKGGDISEWPEDLRVREFPIASTLLSEKQRAVNS